jgi:hypothetical protein
MPANVGAAANQRCVCEMSRQYLTTNSTGAESAWILSSTWMPFADISRPVNSGVRRKFQVWRAFSL